MEQHKIRSGGRGGKREEKQRGGRGEGRGGGGIPATLPIFSVVTVPCTKRLLP
jgi:hypothetical protein